MQNENHDAEYTQFMEKLSLKGMELYSDYMKLSPENKNKFSQECNRRFELMHIKMTIDDLMRAIKGFQR